MRPGGRWRSPPAILAIQRPKEPSHARREDRRPQPQSPPRLHDRRDLRGRDRADRHGDQVAARRQGAALGRLRTRRARRGVAHRRPHRARSSRPTATTTSPSGPASCCSTAPRSTSSWVAPRPRARRSSRCGSTSIRRAGPRSSSGWPAASSSTTGGATSPTGMPAATSRASWPTPSAAGSLVTVPLPDRLRVGPVIEAVDAHAAGEPGPGDRRRRRGRPRRDDVRQDDVAPGEPRRPSPPDAARAARLSGRELQPGPAVEPPRRRRRLRDHGAGRVSRHVRNEHDVRRHGAARDRPPADDGARHGADARVAGRPHPRQRGLPRRKGDRRHVPQRAGVRDPSRGRRSRSRTSAPSPSTSPTAGCSTSSPTPRRSGCD